MRTKHDIKEFEQAVLPALKYLQKINFPYNYIVVTDQGAHLVNGQMFSPAHCIEQTGEEATNGNT